MCFHQKQKAGIKYTNDKVQFTIFLPSNNNKIISKKICGQTMNQMLVKKKYARIRSNISWTNNTLYIYIYIWNYSFHLIKMQLYDERGKLYLSTWNLSLKIVIQQRKCS